MLERNKVRIFKYRKESKIVGRWFDSNNRNPGDQDLAVMVERLFYNGQDGLGGRWYCKHHRVSSTLTLPSLKVRPSTKCVTPTDGQREGATD